MSVCTRHVLILTLGFLASCAPADGAGNEVPVLTAVSIPSDLVDEGAFYFSSYFSQVANGTVDPGIKDFFCAPLSEALAEWLDAGGGRRGFDGSRAPELDVGGRLGYRVEHEDMLVAVSTGTTSDGLPCISGIAAAPTEAKAIVLPWLP